MRIARFLLYSRIDNRLLNLLFLITSIAFPLKSTSVFSGHIFKRHLILDVACVILIHPIHRRLIYANIHQFRQITKVSDAHLFIHICDYQYVPVHKLFNLN